MENFELSEQELTALRKEHRKCQNKRSAYRLNAVILLGSGWTLSDVQDALLIDKSTLTSYVKQYKAGGAKKLIRDNYSGGLSYLTPAQKEKLAVHLQENIYQRAQEITEHIKKYFGVRYSTSGVRDLLHSLGFSYKKPAVVPGKADAAAQQEFLRQYHKLKKTKDDSDPIYFMDGVHPQHNTQASYGWIKRGARKEIKSNTGRQRLNINGAINIETMKNSIVIGEAVNAVTTIELLKKLELRHKSSANIYIVCDNARYYRSRVVNEYLKNSQVKLLFLPPYAPNLNLIERYWKFFKKKVIYNQYYEKFSEFKSECINFFRRSAKYRPELKSLLTENFQIIR